MINRIAKAKTAYHEAKAIYYGARLDIMTKRNCDEKSDLMMVHNSKAQFWARIAQK
jgi:hypothetical protein